MSINNTTPKRPPIEEMREAAGNEWTRQLINYTLHLEAKIEQLSKNQNTNFLSEALNMGDGSYKP